MIRYAMRCAEGHRFDGWFSDSATFDRLQALGQLACSLCGDTRVEKAPMAPAIAAPRAGARPEPEADPAADAGAGQAHAAPATRQGAGPRHGSPPGSPNGAPPPGASGRVAGGPDLAALRARIEAASDDVGRDFAAEARRIHAGEAPERPILGEATVAEAKALAADDIPVLPLPWWQRRDD